MIWSDRDGLHRAGECRCASWHLSTRTLLLAAKEETATTNPVVRFWPLERKVNERTLSILHAHLDDATFAAAWAEGAAMSVEQAVAYAVLMRRTHEHHRLDPSEVATLKALDAVEETTNSIRPQPEPGVGSRLARR